ncbi:hypothetical protein OAT84_02145 [Gammaproteobacteria bacterium]|nr:hypothetical protein [Gammaproteobacteria bacterium]
MLLNFSPVQAVFNYGKEHIHRLSNLFIAPLVCLGYWVPNIELSAIKMLKYNHYSRLVSSIGILQSLGLLFLLTPYAWGYSIPAIAYGVYILMQFLYPDGLQLQSMRLFSSFSYDYIDGVPVAVLQNGVALHGGYLSRLDKGVKVVLHCIGSGDCVSTYISRLWNKDRIKKSFLDNENNVHVCIEQPGVARSNSMLYNLAKQTAVLFIVSLPFWYTQLGLYTTLIIFSMIVPIVLPPFSIQRYANSVEAVMKRLRLSGIKDEKIQINSFSLGGVAVLLWRKLYDASAKVRLLIDRSPQVDSINQYGAKRFLLPALAFYLSFVYCMLWFGAFLSVIEICCFAALPLVIMGLVPTLRSPVLKFALQMSGNWSGLPSMDNINVYNAKTDHVLGDEFKFSSCAKSQIKILDGRHMSTPCYNDSGDIESYSEENESYHNLVNIYEQVVSCLIGRSH